MSDPTKSLAQQIELQAVKNREIIPHIVHSANNSGSNNDSSILEGIKQLISAQATTQHALTSLVGEVSRMNSELSTIQGFKLQLQSAKGQIARLEERESALKDRLLEAELKEMKSNLVFYNLPETKNQSALELRNALYNLFVNTMKIPAEYVFNSPKNHGGEIRIDHAYRMGRFDPGRRRPVVVRFVTVTGKEWVLSKTYTVKLKELPQPVRVSEQFPSEIKERRMAQIDTLKNLKLTHKESGEKIVIVKDKIKINGKPMENSIFEQNTLGSITNLAVDLKHFQQTRRYDEKDSIFQGHIIKVYNTQQAEAARLSLLQDSGLAKAQHLVYAYKYVKEDGEIYCGYSDDQEIGAGQILMSNIDKHKSINVFLCVSRNKNGGNIGKSRFDLVGKCANEALKLDEQFLDPEDVFRKVY